MTGRRENRWEVSLVESTRELFRVISERVAATGERWRGLDCSFQFVLSGEDGGSFYVRIVGGEPDVAEGVLEEPGVTIRLTADDFKKVVEGTLDTTSAFFAGKIKVEGDLGLAMQLQSLLRRPSS